MSRFSVARAVRHAVAVVRLAPRHRQTGLLALPMVPFVLAGVLALLAHGTDGSWWLRLCFGVLAAAVPLLLSGWSVPADLPIHRGERALGGYLLHVVALLPSSQLAWWLGVRWLGAELPALVSITPAMVAVAAVVLPLPLAVLTAVPRPGRQPLQGPQGLDPAFFGWCVAAVAVALLLSPVGPLPTLVSVAGFASGLGVVAAWVAGGGVWRMSDETGFETARDPHGPIGPVVAREVLFMLGTGALGASAFVAMRWLVGSSEAESGRALAHGAVEGLLWGMALQVITSSSQRFVRCRPGSSEDEAWLRHLPIRPRRVLVDRLRHRFVIGMAATGAIATTGLVLGSPGLPGLVAAVVVGAAAVAFVEVWFWSELVLGSRPPARWASGRWRTPAAVVALAAPFVLMAVDTALGLEGALVGPVAGVLAVSVVVVLVEGSRQVRQAWLALGA